MEIDITDLVRDGETWGYSGSVATHGPCAGRQTWANALEGAKEHALLATDEALDAMRRWMKESGAWDKAEREAMSDQELNALFLQLVAGDLREIGLEDCDPDEFDWVSHEAMSDGGNAIFRCDIPGHEAEGRIFYSLE